MHTPYSSNPVEAYAIVHTSIATLVGAFALHRSVRPRVAEFAFFGAVVMVAVAPSTLEFVRYFVPTCPPTIASSILRAAMMLAAFGAITTRRWTVIAGALSSAALSIAAIRYLKDSDWEIAELHSILLAATIALFPSDTPVAAPVVTELRSRNFRNHDLFLFGLATTLAVVTVLFVTRGQIDSSDEWANTFQAATFARFKAYATEPTCGIAFENFYVFHTHGRFFSMYTPGWPLFMAPFAFARVVWLAGPVSFGLLTVGVARVARRMSALFQGLEAVGPSGIVAGVLTATSIMLVVNGASRFSHVFVASMFAWGVEFSFAATEPNVSVGNRWLRGIGLGTCAAFLVAARPGDGLTLGVGLFVFNAYAFVTRRHRWQTVVGILAALAIVGGFMLVILRLQLGKWFATGYSLLPILQPWNIVRYNVPRPDEWRWGIPLATSAFCWWPATYALGAAGLVSLRGTARSLWLLLFASYLPFEIMYVSVDLGRGSDWGYGPRYTLPLVVPMVIGAGVALAPVWVRARRFASSRSALREGGPFAVIALTLFAGFVRLVPLLIPATSDSVKSLSGLFDDVARQNIHQALVMLPSRSWRNGGLDHTQNLPVSLYPNQDNIFAMEPTPEVSKCLLSNYPERTIYRAFPGTPTRFDLVRPPGVVTP